MWLLLAFLTVPLIEIALFIQVGGAIGLWPTLGVVVLTAILGTFLVRSQGALALGRLRGAFERLDDPTEPLAHAAMILIAGVLLLTPGFFTDALGFALLVPAVRQAAFRYIRRRVRMESFVFGGTEQASGMEDGMRPDDAGAPWRGEVIEGEFIEIERRAGGSGWTRH
ncbi:MAG: hypothetical protein Kow0058_00880 [Roseovarius sp.]